MRAVARMRGSEVSPHQRLLEALEGEDTGDGVLSSIDILNTKPHPALGRCSVRVSWGEERGLFL